MKTREATARVFQTRAATTIRICRSRIDALKARIDQAESERNQPLRKQLESDCELERVCLRARRTGLAPGLPPQGQREQACWEFPSTGMPNGSPGNSSFAPWK